MLPAGRARQSSGDEGFLMAALLVGMAVTAIWMSAMLPTWRQQAQRQREDDLIFRGEQYARAIALFATKNNGALPTSIDDLVQQRYLRKKWKDPITGKDFMILGAGSMTTPGGAGGRGGTSPGGTPSPQQSGALAAGGISGVYSESQETSIRVYNNAQQYNQWIFTYQGALLRMGRIGAPGPAGGGRQGGRGNPFGGGRGGTELQPIRGGGGGRGARGGASPGDARPGGIRGGGARGRGAGS